MCQDMCHLRLDKIKEHESSTDHINSVAIETDQNNASKCTKNMNSEAQNAIGDAIKVLYFMVQDNLPLDLFSTNFLIKLSVLVHTYCPFIHRSHA